MSAQLDLLPACRIPERGSQCYELLMAMQSGVRLTIWNAMNVYHVGALSQRIGDLKREYGWPIKDRFVESPGGSRFKEYWIERCVGPLA